MSCTEPHVLWPPLADNSLSVAYLALPIILNSIDLQTLSMANTRAEGKRSQLRLLNEAMDLCKDRYTGAAVVKNVITKKEFGGVYRLVVLMNQKLGFIDAKNVILLGVTIRNF